jgi:hypothetical protein
MSKKNNTEIPFVESFDLKMGKITPKEIWDRKDEWFDNAKKSKNFWEKNMDSEKREAVLRIVKYALELLHDDVENWVPESIDSSGGSYMNVDFKILFTDIDKEIDRHNEVTSFQIENAKKDLQGILLGDINA